MAVMAVALSLNRVVQFGTLLFLTVDLAWMDELGSHYTWYVSSLHFVFGYADKVPFVNWWSLLNSPKERGGTIISWQAK